MRRGLGAIAGVAVVFVCLGVSEAAESASGKLERISLEELVAGVQSRSLYVYDNNDRSIYQRNHIPSAIHLDPGDPDLTLFPSDKRSSLVFYCKNEWCTASHVGARIALRQGYRNVRVFPDGIEGWIKAGQRVESVSP